MNKEQNTQAGAAAPVAAQAGQVAPAEELTRFCPACGSVGDIGPEYRDCCPDGNESRRIPESLAEKCRELFKAALHSGVAAGQVAVPEMTDEQIVAVWQSMPGGPDGWLKQFGYLQFARALLAAAPAAPAQAKPLPADWISVDEAEPLEGELVAARYWPYDNHENPQAVTGMRYIDGTFFDDEGDEAHPPSHWYRLPAFDAAATAQASTTDVRSQEGGA